jgi:hypothetical protein
MTMSHQTRCSTSLFGGDESCSHDTFTSATGSAAALQERLLERIVRHSTPVPSSSPTIMSAAPSLAPISDQDAAAAAADTGGGIGWFGMGILLLIGVAALWGLWVRYQRQVEQRMLDFRSKQADRVLGDMQMVPNEDLDNELL